MYRSVKLRKQYGDNWLTCFPDLEIPWRQLSLQEFLSYDKLFSSKKYIPEEIEDEIFSLAVLEDIYIENIDILPAGIVTTVVAQIMQASGPATVNQIAEDLNVSRANVQDFVSSSVTMICSVFPAYKPEDVFSLKYNVFMDRLAMAEGRLLQLGVLKEPLSVLGKEVTEQSSIREKPSQRRRREIMESRAKLESKLQDLNKEEDAPVSSGGTVISGRQMSTSFSTDTGHEREDKALWQHDAIAGLEYIYPEYFKAMREGTKITPDLIQKTKGRTASEVSAKHDQYVNKLKSGEIQPKPSKQLVSNRLEAQSSRTVAENKGKVKVKRGR